VQSESRSHANGILAILVAFLSASQDVVIDAYRIEILTPDQQGPGAAMIQTGYRIGLLVAGAGALIIAARWGWFAAYATIAALFERRNARVHFRARAGDGARRATAFRLDTMGRFSRVARDCCDGTFADFMRRPMWPAIVISSSVTSSAKRWRA